MLLEVDAIDVFYGDIQALREITLEVAEGEIVSVLGSNGAGKSTLLKAVSGLLDVRSGEVRLDGDRLDGSHPEKVVRSGVTYVPEGRELFPTLTVRDNLLAGGLHHARRDRERALRNVTELFPVLGSRLRQKAGTMSGGEQQMLAIGRALMAEPRLMLIDEMSLGVAPIIVKQLFDVAVDLRARGTTLLLVEQNANEALAVADRGYVLETGTIAVVGDAADLRDNPQVRDAYMGLGAKPMEKTGDQLGNGSS